MLVRYGMVFVYQLGSPPPLSHRPTHVSKWSLTISLACGNGAGQGRSIRDPADHTHHHHHHPHLGQPKSCSRRCSHSQYQESNEERPLPIALSVSPEGKITCSRTQSCICGVETVLSYRSVGKPSIPCESWSLSEP